MEYQSMKVTVGQFIVSLEREINAVKCIELMREAALQKTGMLALPVAQLARADDDPDLSVKSVQTLTGCFIGLLLDENRNNTMTTILTIHVFSSPGRATHTLVALQNG